MNDIKTIIMLVENMQKIEEIARGHIMHGGNEREGLLEIADIIRRTLETEV